MVISAALREGIESEIARFPEPGGALLGALHAVQAEHGCVSLEAASELAGIFGRRPVEILEIVSFYNMFHEAPRGQNQVYVCTSLSCSLRGATTLLRKLEAHLGLHAGESSADGRIHLGREECLGACANAPMMRVGDTYHEDLDFDHAREILDGLS